MSGRVARAIVVCLLILAVPHVFQPNPYTLGVGVQILLFSVAGLGAWLLLNGGLWSFGQGAFALVGSYVSTILVMRAGLPFWVSMPLAALAGGVVATTVAIPLLRTSGVTFAILTIVGLLAVDQIIVLFPEWTNGRGGIVGVPPPDSLIFGDITVSFSQPLNQYYVAAGLFVISFLAVVLIVDSRWFRTFSAIRQQPLLARSVGVAPRRYFIAAFAFAGVITAAAGAYSAPYYGVAHPKLWFVFPSIFIVAYAIVGGVRSPYGPLLGATALIFAAELTRATASFQLVLVAFGMIIATVALPDGIAGIGPTLVDWTRRLRLVRRR